MTNAGALRPIFQETLVALLIDDATEITYEVGINEPLHPDINIALRMNEHAMSRCEFGCKIYKDPRSGVKVLAHNRIYGCTKTAPLG